MLMGGRGEKDLAVHKLQRYNWPHQKRLRAVGKMCQTMRPEAAPLIQEDLSATLFIPYVNESPMIK